jgi:hypothetical protein
MGAVDKKRVAPYLRNFETNFQEKIPTGIETIKLITGDKTISYEIKIIYNKANNTY